MRIGGLASGMDIDQMVNDLMKAERVPLDKIKQKKQVLQWQRDDYRSMNTLLLNFRSDLLNMRLSSTYRVRTATSTDESKLSATATSAAGKGSFSISNVTQLASSATKVNAGAISGGTKIDPSKGLYESQSSFGDSSFGWKQGSVESQTINVDTTGNTAQVKLNGDAKIVLTESISIKVNGKSYEVIANGAEFDGTKTNQVKIDELGNLEFQEPIEKDSTIKVDFIADKKVDTFSTTGDTASFQLSRGSISETDTVTIKFGEETFTSGAVKDGKIELKDKSDKVVGSIEASTGKVTLNDDAKIPKDTEVTVEYKQNYFTFGLETATSKGMVNETFFVQGTESLNQVISKVNSSSAGVTMFYDSFKDQVTLTRTEQGKFDSQADQINTSGDFLNKVLRFQDKDGKNVTEVGGQNAKFTINGLETERNSNTFTIDGVTFTLKQTFTDAPVSVSISNDSNKVYENIKGFVDKYNELIGTINKKLTEDRYRDYKPLTDEEREGLSDKQQELWEEKAKSGLLKRDPILSQALSSMRMDFYAPVQTEGVNPLYKQLASIGITTTANYLDGGKLEINEAKLKKAIEEDPEGIEKLFNGSGTTHSQKGIAQRLTDSVDSAMNKLKEKAGNSSSTNQQFAIGRQLSDMDKQIDRFEDKMKQVEARYWRQFTAMENAILRANQQSAQLMQQFNSGY